jgi:predicted hydrocarbon binding protein
MALRLNGAPNNKKGKPMDDRKYSFNWSLLGDIGLGRPNLGQNTRLEVYRLMQFTIRDVLEQHLGSQETDKIFYEAGKLAGTHFYHHFLTGAEDLDSYIARMQETLRELGIGILRIEEADLEQGSLVLTVSEDLDCSGLPELEYEICVYDEGFIAALLENFTGRNFKVKEIDCWCTGDRTCRFKAEAI